VWSRVAIWAAVLLVIVALQPAWFNEPAETVRRPPGIGSFPGIWAQWDGQWFLHIAEHGYGGGGGPAFFPLYPGAVALLGRILGSQFVLAGILVSLAACLGSFRLLYCLAKTRLGSEGARRAVLYLAIFPMALFLQSVYSESLYLVSTLAAFLFAERRRFLAAGVMGGLAMLTRAGGVALLPALALLAWRAPNRARSLAELAVAPLMFAAYPVLLWQQMGDPWGFLHAEETWHRHIALTGPFGGIWDGLNAGWLGLRAFWTATSSHSSAPLRPDLTNIEYAAFLVVFILLTVVAWRRFGAPYGVFAVCSLALPLSVPAAGKPLLSLPRFGLAIFPIFLALAAVGERPRLHRLIVAVSLLLLGFHLVDWSFNGWVS
jgi:Mannosyltransferase (PIG-V)